MWDLEECRTQLAQTGKIESFPVDRFDVSACLRWPHILYGREREKEILQKAFERAYEGQAVTVMVSGYSGIGKTMLINETIKPLILTKGYFITGKFDQLEQNIPYAPIAAAFINLIKQLMTENRDKLDWWKKRILKAIGCSGSVIIEIIPELEWIIGKQPPKEPLPPKEAENRFLLIFRDFIKVFAWKGHPLVIFLDDLQWADYASLNLLKYLTQDANLHHVLFIGAFRDNELDDSHPLTQILAGDFKEKSTNILISLKPLKGNEVSKLVSETLNKEPEKVTVLSELLYRLSAGNPFFLKQMLTLLVDEGLLYFNIAQGCWAWNREAIEQLQPAKDVLKLILKKIQRLPEKTSQLMKLAACIGNRFDIETLAAVYGRPMDETAACLMPAVIEGLVLEIKGDKEDRKPAKASLYPGLKSTVFEFLHDRVQQAVYSSISEDEKKKKHLEIGRLLLGKTSHNGLEEGILSVMDHFNRSLELIHDPKEKKLLAEYNLLAGRKAKASAAYASALQYFRNAKALLPDDAWIEDYDLSYDINLELAQAEYMSANIKTAEKLFNIIIEKSKDDLEKASIYGLKMILYAGTGRYNEAVRMGIKALKNLGVYLPIKPTLLDYAKEMLIYKWYMRNKKIEDLITLPEMTDSANIKIAELLTRLCYVTMTTNPELYSLTILKAGNHSICHGNTEMTPVGYSGYSITSSSLLGNYEVGERYGRVCIYLAEKYNKSSTKCIVYFVEGAFISHWTRHASFSLEYLKKAVSSGMEAGDVLIIGYAHCLLLEMTYLLGVPFTKVEEEISKKHEIAKRLKHENLAVNAVLYEEVLSVLQGKKADSLASGMIELERDELKKLVQKDQSSLATYYCLKTQLYYLSGDYRKALESVKKVEPLMGSILGFMISVEYCFYYCLVIAAVYHELSFKEKIHYRKVLYKKLRQMKKWANHSKDNFEHKYLLIAAELARLHNKKELAMNLYDKAIQSASESCYIQNEAIANELAARFYLSLNLNKIASLYMLDAYKGYTRWGAFAKAKELVKKYPEILDGMDIEEQKIDIPDAFEKVTSIITPSENEAAAVFDNYFIEKAVENISKETDINNLFKFFLETAVQSVGADKGYLILEEKGELFIEALKERGSAETRVNMIDLEKYHKIAKGVIRYVARTLETLVLNGREKIGIFATDPYIADEKPGSIACLPLLFQGIPFGVLYLENSYIPGAFSQDRLDTLRLLFGQVAYAKKLQNYLQEDTNDSKQGVEPNLIETFTEREMDVLKLVADGLSNKEIGERLDMTVNTVKTHIKNIYGKLQVNRRVQAVEKARKLGLL